MGLFKEKSEDYIDYTILQKKGIINAEETEGRILNLGASTGASVHAVHSPLGNTSSFETNPFGFLDSAAASSSSSGEGGSYYGSTDTKPVHPEINSLKIRIEDLEYKIERLLEKIAKVEEKIGSV